MLAARADRVKEWAKDGLLLVGDAAHTCSPAGAIGVSVAVATAIVAADVIADCLRTGDYSRQALGRVQALRAAEVVEIQRIQNGFAGLVAAKHPLLKALLVAATFLAARTGLFRRVLRRMLVMERPLPVSESIRL